MRSDSNELKRLMVLISIFVSLIGSIASADDGNNLGKAGIAVSLQGRQLDIIIPYWISDIVVISPSIYLIHVNEVANEIGIGVGIRNNFPKGGAYPYIGARFGALILKPEGSKHITDYIGSVVVGGERFFGDNFSAGVEAQLNIAKSDVHSSRFGNPNRFNINTATTIYATFYFK
jgi:hypothetical protein